jgi:hypothetical protein
MKKFVLITLTLFLCLAVPCNPKENRIRIAIGLNCGYSFLAERDYYEEYRYDSEYRRESKLGFRGGANLQCYFGRHFALQIETDHQRNALFEEFKDYTNPEYNYSRSQDISYTVYYLNFIYRISDFSKQKLSPYIFAGAGIYNFDPFTLYSKMGLGIQYNLSPRVMVHTEVSLGPAAFIYKDPSAFRFFPFDIKYISFNFGLDFLL